MLPNGNIISEIIDLNQVPCIIGRDRADARIVINDDSVSRRHAEILSRNGSIAIRDLGSTNGTKVRGRDIGYNIEVLYPSNEITIGSIRLNVSVC